MAVGTSTSYFSNAIVGVPQVGVDIDIHQVDLTPKYPVGFGFERADGNKYRYCHFGEATNRGTVVSTDESESTVDDPTIHIGSASVTDVEGEIISPNEIGSHYIQCSITAVAHQLAGGTAIITSGTGLGFTYRVKDNTGTGTPAAGEAYLQLYRPLVTTIRTDSGIRIHGCPYSNLETCDLTTDTDIVPVGVSMNNASASNYAWIQTKGQAGVLNDVTLAGEGYHAYCSSLTPGAVMHMATVIHTNESYAVKYPVIGYYIGAGSGAEYSCVYLTLE